MPLSVADVLTLDILRDGRVVAGEEHLVQRTVRSVAVIEVPVGEFVREGDLVLTTALGVGHDDALFAAFARDIARSGAAALLVAIGPHAQVIPAEVTEVAATLALPLVALPWEVTFSDISHVVLGRLLDEQHAVVRESLALQGRLTQLVVDGADLAGLARALATMLSRPVAIADASGQILARGVLARGGASAGFEAHVQEAVQRHVLRSAGATTTGSDAVRLLPENGLTLAAIESGRETLGYIATPIGSGSLTVAEQLTLQHAVTAAALCLLQYRAAQETALRLRDDFVWSLAASTIASPADAMARGHLLGYDLSRRYVGIYGKIEPGEGDERHGQTARSRQRILDAIEAAATHERRAVMTTVVGDVVVAFVEVRRSNDSLEGMVARMAARLRDHVPAVTVSWGIGAAHDGFANFRQTYDEARAACQIGVSVRGTGSVTHVSQTGAYRVLLGMSADAESRRFWEDALRELVAYGEHKEIDLLGTLETYLGAQGNVSETARRLGLHRQSLLHRLQRIEELTGGDLADPQHRFALELSMRLYRLRDIAPADQDWTQPRPRGMPAGRRDRPAKATWPEAGRSHRTPRGRNPA